MQFSMYFYQCIYQIECLRCQVLSREGLYEWDMLAIKIFFFIKCICQNIVFAFYNKQTSVTCTILNKFLSHVQSIKKRKEKRYRVYA